ncbi:MAG: adenosylcobinamide-GDP ribazoletransferase [Bacillota bacterium]|nr:adenosylcobinamide-GDP ribazoletransferase [Bacillota bacterium]
MYFFRSIAAAFSMFSRIPMPQVKWDEKTTTYLLCAFPLVGLLIGGAELLWLWLSQLLQLGSLLRAVGLSLLPLLLSGGIHMDGFCDVQDALACHGSPEQRREILKDPRSGAFAVIGAAAYLLAWLGLASELPTEGAASLLFALSFLLSRSLSALLSRLYPKDTGKGLLHTFRSGQKKKAPMLLLLLWNAGTFLVMLLLDPLRSAAMLFAATLCLLRLLHLARQKFGGISGDLSGWFLQWAELAMLGALILTEKVVSL